MAQTQGQEVSGGTGRRKEAVVRVRLVPGTGQFRLNGRTLEDFRPRHLRVVGARDAALDPEEQALLSLLRSWRLQQARQEAEKAA